MGGEVTRYTAFSSEPYGGNPAGVVLDARELNEDTMLRIAGEVGYSETAFVLPRGREHSVPGEYDIRYYSPLAEVTFCGHATIATAVALAERNGTGRVLLHTRAGKVPVDTSMDGTLVNATLTSVPTSSCPVAAGDVDAALDALGWTRQHLDPDFPLAVAYAGAHHLMVPVATREVLASLDYDFDRLADLMAARDWTTMHLFWRESPTVFHARDPFPPGGVVEDPATGAAAAAFGGYLKANGIVTAPAEITVYQGADMGRPSTLEVTLSAEHDQTQVTGTAVPIRTP